MCNKAAYNYPHGLEFIPEYYKSFKKMGDKSVNNYRPTIKSVPEYLLIQEMCRKSVNSIQDRSFWGCSQMGEGKDPSPL